MRLYEFEAKELFKEGGINIPDGILIERPEEIDEIPTDLEYPLVIKTQVLIGGRGKEGGIKFAENREELEDICDELYDIKIRGYDVSSLLIEEKIEHTDELYLGVTIDRVNYRVVLIASTRGGVNIEGVAREKPQDIKRLLKRIDDNLHIYEVRSLIHSLGFSGKALLTISDALYKLYEIFMRYEAKLVEINPLALLEDGTSIALDARMSVDEDSLFRHPELERFNLKDRHEEGEMTEREKSARDLKIPYLDLDGNIGMFPGGAGFGIMGIDFINYFGGKPANFMDSGGGPSPERLADMLELLNENEKIDAIFGARFGGVSRCDDFARGLVIFLEDNELRVPMALRMTGNMWREGLEILRKAMEENPERFKNIELYGIETPIEEVCKRAIALASGDEVKKT